MLLEYNNLFLSVQGENSGKATLDCAPGIKTKHLQFCLHACRIVGRVAFCILLVVEADHRSADTVVLNYAPIRRRINVQKTYILPAN